MKYTLSLIALAGLVLWSSCKNSSSADSPSNNTNPGTTNPALTSPANQSSAHQQGNTTNTTTSAMLNPEHGKPGHRCDLPVGAPLNTAASPNQNISTSIPPTNTTITSPQPVLPPNSLNTSPATNLNPAHGQPGHRCDIPVGSPLTSKPNQ